MSETITLPELEVLQITDDPASSNMGAKNHGLPASGVTPEYWRSLEEWSRTDEFNQFISREYPSQSEVLVDPVSRRNFLKLMAASIALAGFTACTKQPREEILPYIKQPEEEIPNKPLYFATAMPMSGSGIALLARSNEGRPTKIEGNPDHPSSLGATDIFAQAAILGLYDPDRAQAVTYLGEIRSWSSFVAELRSVLDVQKTKQGAGLRILTEAVGSPTLASQLKEILTDFPQAKWYQYETASRDGARGGAMAAFGEAINTVYNFKKADRIFSIDSDFLNCGLSSVRYSKDFAARRKLRMTRIADDSHSGEALNEHSMSRFYAIESTVTNTGAVSDHRLSIRPSEIEPFVKMVAAKIGIQIPGANTYAAHSDYIEALAKDLLAHRGRSLIIAGDEQSPLVHAIAHSMNSLLGNIGESVIYTDPIEAQPANHLDSLRQLVTEMNAGAVDTLLILGANPVYTAPADIPFADAMQKVRLRIHHSLYRDETSEYCHWHVPEAHFLEAWSDVRTHDGTVTIVQPLIAPLYHGKSAHEILAIFGDNPDRSGYEIVQSFWKKPPFGGSVFDQSWRKAVHDGTVPGTALSIRNTSLNSNISSWFSNAQPSAEGLDVVFRLDPTIYDGRFANLGWLQELPKPISKIVWDNVALVNPRTAKKYGLENTLGKKGGDYIVDMAEIELAGRKIEMPVWILAGIPDDTITLYLGYGRTNAGRVGSNLGFNVNKIRTSTAPWYATGAKLRKTGNEYVVATTQSHWSMEGRAPVRSATLQELIDHPGRIAEEEPPPAPDVTLFPPYEYKGHKWAMSIDLNACTGCSACTIACQSENNIPVVGKEQVIRSREMHWIRVDRYYTGDVDNPETYFQPVPCMHCENAPCEIVCPVEATAHSAEGLNDMVYNRCVGTRYCANNCPYKVRRFNFLLFQDWTTPSFKMMRNPDVSVRSRGVMEKCSYCVQRIQYAKIEAEKQNRPIADGEIRTACQAACPADAIVFGDLNDPNAEVTKLRKDKRSYGLLADLNTQPRTTYLGAVRNPNSELEKGVHTAEQA